MSTDQHPLSPAVKCWPLGHVWLFVTPWTLAHQAPLSMGFSRQEYWSGLAFPPPGNFPNPRVKPMSPALQVDFLPVSHLGNTESRVTQGLAKPSLQRTVLANIHSASHKTLPQDPLNYFDCFIHQSNGLIMTWLLGRLNTWREPVGQMDF